MKHPPMLLREGGHHQRPGEAGSAVVTGLACSAAIGTLWPRRFHGLRVARQHKGKHR